MAIFHTFSRRQKERGDETPIPEVPTELRVQVIHILARAVGSGAMQFVGPNPLWAEIYQQLTEETGRFVLSKQASTDNPAEQCGRYLLETTSEAAADFIDLAFSKLETFSAPWRQYVPVAFLLSDFGATSSVDSAVADLNGRFRQHGVPFEFVDGMLARTDSDYLHQEATRPALQLLHDARFAGAQQEFRRAHEHYRAGRWDEAVSEANQAFESTMKCALTEARTRFGPGDAASALVKTMLESKIFADVDSHYRGKLQSVLAGKLPPVRNPLDHGAGPLPRTATQEIAAYALHLAASDIVFVISMLRRYRH